MKSNIRSSVAFSGVIVTHPHGYADGAVHVAFVEPAVFRHPSLLRSERGCVLGGVLKKKTTSILEFCPET